MSVKQMKTLIEWLWDETREGLYVCGGDIQDKMASLQLLDVEPYSIKEHGTKYQDEYDAQEGDHIYKLDLNLWKRITPDIGSAGYYLFGYTSDEYNQPVETCGYGRASRFYDDSCYFYRSGTCNCGGEEDYATHYMEIC